MHYYYGYDEFLKDSKELTERINWKFDTIIGIARGGLTLSHFLGEYYNIREVYAINTIGYENTQKLENTKVFNLPNLENAKNVLIVDDIVDSGDTLNLVLETLLKEYPSATFKSAALFYKPTASIKPNWYVQEAKVWIDFFWTVDLLGNKSRE